MSGEQKVFFEKMNIAWLELQPCVKDPEPYKKVMNELFKMFFNNIPDKFSDEWWKKTVDNFFRYSKLHYEGLLSDFVGELVMGMLNYREHEQKLNQVSPDIFYNDIVGAYNNERDRISKRISGGILSEAQGTKKTELQCSDTVCKMGRSEEDNLPLKAEDWN